MTAKLLSVVVTGVSALSVDAEAARWSDFAKKLMPVRQTAIIAARAAPITRW
jgi:hypothetical protein